MRRVAIFIAVAAMQLAACAAPQPRTAYQLWPDELGAGATPEKQLRSLDKGVPYWVAVEAFDETEVSKLSKVARIR